MHVTRIIATAIAAASLTWTTAAVGHGEGGQGKPKAAVDYSKAEETPFGRAGNPRTVSRTIRIDMNDRMQFVAASVAARSMPGDIVIKRGQTVRFLVRNEGQVMHEMVIGRMQELKEHAELMRRFPEMEHDEPYMAHVAPGKEAEIVWQFTRAGEFHYACLIPGHMEAGMIARITVK